MTNLTTYIMTASEALERLRNIDLRTYPIDEVYRLLSCLDKVGVLVKIIPEKTKIYRIRPDFWNLHEEKELKYCPVDKCTKAQRATLRGQTLFYGVISNDYHSVQGAEYVCLFECTKKIKQTDNNHVKDICTIGEWETQRPIQLACIVDDDKFEDVDNVLLSEMKALYQRLRISNEHFNDVQTFLCDEFAKKVEHDTEDYQYLISALYTNIVIGKLPVEGILYPPVRTEGSGGMNVAIIPSLIDDGSITLSGIRELEVFLHQEKAIIIPRKCYSYPQLEIVSENKISDKDVWDYFNNK